MRPTLSPSRLKPSIEPAQHSVSARSTRLISGLNRTTESAHPLDKTNEKYFANWRKKFR